LVASPAKKTRYKSGLAPRDTFVIATPRGRFDDDDDDDEDEDDDEDDEDEDEDDEDEDEDDVPWTDVAPPTIGRLTSS